jgi:transposase
MKTNYVKHTQKDYPLSLKLQIVQSIEQGKLSTTEATRKYGIQCRKTVVNWLRKYGNFDWENQTPNNMPKTPQQRLLELGQEIRLLKKQKSFLEKQVEQSDKKAIMFDMMIDLAEKEYNIPIRKNSKPE